MLGALTLAAACEFPRDVEGTLDRVRGGTLRVGAIEGAPFIVTDGEQVTGVEARLVEQLAGSLDADLEWVTGTSDDLLAALEHHSLDLVVGGLVSDDPWGSKVTFTLPYATSHLVVSVSRGTDPPSDIAGRPVAVPSGTEAEGLLRKTDAEVQPVEQLDDTEGLVAAHDWELDDLGLTKTNVELATSEHVFALPHGENAWLVELENFVLDIRPTAQRLLEQARTSD
jgi:polar amino acid transport system substrate-binding protein